MNTPRRHSLRWLVRRRKRGQSIPIIALMIVILIAMVGLSVDVGNTFSHEREAVSASNAASIAGMSAYMGRPAGTPDKSIYDSIVASLKSNGITPGDGTGGTLQLNAYYLDSEGKRLAGHEVVGSGGEAPSGATFIQVSLNGKVDTSFARVVGRPDLPINADSYASACLSSTGVYPIGIDAQVLSNGAFNKYGTTGKSPEYFKNTSLGYYQQRIFLKDDNAPGSFSWLRWKQDKGAMGKAATSAEELNASMLGAGNLGKGFDEAPLPSGEIVPDGGYPTQPNTLDPGDWVWGSPGWKSNNTLEGALDAHTLHTKMILPIYDKVIGSGSNVEVHVQSLGLFMLVGRGKDPGKGPYYDMVYFGNPDAQRSACSATPPSPKDITKYDLQGNVSFYPEYQIVPTEQKPMQYVVVLDASGSMSANFNGQCDNKDGLKQCANGPAGYPAVEVSNTGVEYYWSNQKERRIYVAKQALMRLVKLTNMNGNVGYTNTRPSDQMAVVWFNESVPSGNVKGFSSDRTSITDFITTINNGYGNYRSQGGTNGAGGLYRASLLYNAAPKTVTQSGKTFDYKRVVIFITDGVSNQFLDTSADNLLGGQSNANTYAKNSYCRNLGNLVVESASCQTTVVGSTYNDWDRPITQMIKTSQTYLRNTTTNAEVFVIALSNIDATGLRDGIPSTTSYYYPATELKILDTASGKTNVDEIIETISAKVTTGKCTVGTSDSTSVAISSGEFPVGNYNGMVYPQVGLVTITNQSTGAQFTAPIKAATGGTISYKFTDVPQGNYQMTAYVYYHHSLDAPGVVRRYGLFWLGGTVSSTNSVTIGASAQNSGFQQVIDMPIILKLEGSVC